MENTTKQTTSDPTVINYYGDTNVGQARGHNEDSFIIVDLSEQTPAPMGYLLMIADGMGGANAGEVASAIACKEVENQVQQLTYPLPPQDVEKYLKSLLINAHHQIIEYAQSNPECAGMGTTAVIAWILDGYLHVVWCGDSRCYVFQPDQEYPLQPFTEDHSLVWQMVQQGELTPEQARVHEHSNIILQALGSTDGKPTPSYLARKLDGKEKILLCSDGLNSMLSDFQIQQIIENHSDVEKVTELLVQAANNVGGLDNITVLYADVLSPGNTSHQAKGRSILQTLKNKWIFVLITSIILSALVVFVVRGEENNHKMNINSEDSNRNQITAVNYHDLQLQPLINLQSLQVRGCFREISSISTNSENLRGK
ncbi:MAG: PP2C family protein-serine/threonine phosphatase [Cyclobacteriaceae bacterium]